MSLIDDLEKWIAPLRRKVAGLVVQALVKEATLAGPIQLYKVQTAFDEVSTDVPRVEQYGLISNPVGTDYRAIILQVNGNRNQQIMIAVDDPNSKPIDMNDAGASGLFNSGGCKIYLKGNDIKITVPTGGKFSITDGTFEVTA